MFKPCSNQPPPKHNERISNVKTLPRLRKYDLLNNTSQSVGQNSEYIFLAEQGLEASYERLYTEHAQTRTQAHKQITKQQHTLTHAETHTDTDTHTHTHPHTHPHTHTHIHTHTHTRTYTDDTHTPIVASQETTLT